MRSSRITGPGSIPNLMAISPVDACFDHVVAPSKSPQMTQAQRKLSFVINYLIFFSYKREAVICLF